MIDKKLLDILACPDDKASVKFDAKKNVLTCTKCKRVFEIKNDIPIMLPAEKK